MLLHRASIDEWDAAHQIAFVEEQQQMLVAGVLLEVMLQVSAACAQGVPRIQHLHAHPGGLARGAEPGLDSPHRSPAG